MNWVKKIKSKLYFLIPTIKAAVKHELVYTIASFWLVFTSVSNLQEISQNIDNFAVWLGKYEDTNKGIYSTVKLIISFVFTFLILGFINFRKSYLESINRAKLAECALLTYYKPNNDSEEIKQAEERLKFKAENSESIKILGASGLLTFGAEESPLYEAIKKCGHVRIMLLHPFGEMIDKRVKSILAFENPDFTEEDYQVRVDVYHKEIAQSIKTLKKFRAINSDSIKLGFYDENPLIKLIILHDNFVWLQHYDSGENVRDLPTYFFEKDDDQSGRGLFRMFLTIFNRRWSHTTANRDKNFYDFDTGTIYDPVSKKRVKFPSDA